MLLLFKCRFSLEYTHFRSKFEVSLSICFAQYEPFKGLESGILSFRRGKLQPSKKGFFSWASCGVDHFFSFFSFCSAWDTKEARGTQTVNAIVLVELGDEHADVVLDETSER
jgi:hypothetical protein